MCQEDDLSTLEIAEDHSSDTSEIYVRNFTASKCQTGDPDNSSDRPRLLG